jgi:hypothetical protein
MRTSLSIVLFLLLFALTAAVPAIAAASEPGAGFVGWALDKSDELDLRWSRMTGLAAANTPGSRDGALVRFRRRRSRNRALARRHLVAFPSAQGYDELPAPSAQHAPEKRRGPGSIETAEPRAGPPLGAVHHKTAAQLVHPAEELLSFVRRIRGETEAQLVRQDKHKGTPLRRRGVAPGRPRKQTENTVTDPSVSWD